MNKSLAVHYLKLSADQGLSLSQLELADLLLRGDHGSLDFAESENYLRLAVGQGSSAGQLRLGLGLFYGSFDHLIILTFPKLEIYLTYRRSLIHLLWFSGMRFRCRIVNCLVHQIFSEMEIPFQFSDSRSMRPIFH
jgi:hypothetical protein